MDYNLAQNLAYCKVIVDEFAGLLLYSHIPTAGIALLIGIYVFLHNRNLLAGILFTISVVFALWSISDLLIWLNYDQSSLIMSLWAPIEILAVLLFILCLYFAYVFIDQKDVGVSKKVIWIVMFLPMILTFPTAYNLESYDLQECVAVETTIYQQYDIVLQAIFSLWILGLLLFRYFKAPSELRKKILFLGVGMLVFILSFFVAGYISAETYNYTYEMYGLFAMVAFMSALAYLIVRFKTFNLKVFGAQALIVALVILIASQFAFVETNTNRILITTTLILTILIGLNLIKSVRREIELRENLSKANKGQANLLHFINHQIKGYLAKSRIIFSELRDDPDYGPMPEQAKPLINEGFNSLTEGTNFVQQILKGSNIEKGVIGYDMKPTDFRGLVLSVAEEMKEPAQKKGLEYKIEFDEEDYQINGDEKELKEAVKNFIDNSIKYTPSGSISLKLSRQDGKVLFSVKDTGIGMSDETKEKLFTKGGRGKDSQKINIYSTGFGLSIVKGIIEAHKGRVWAESDGEGKGSAFYMELPIMQ